MTARKPSTSVKDLLGPLGFVVAAMVAFRLVYGAWPPLEGELGPWLASDSRAVWAMGAGIVAGCAGLVIGRAIGRVVGREM